MCTVEQPWEYNFGGNHGQTRDGKKPRAVFCSPEAMRILPSITLDTPMVYNDCKLGQKLKQTHRKSASW